MILSKRPEIERFIKSPPADVRACLIHGRDRGGVHERATSLARALVPDINDPFDVSALSESDLDADSVRLDDALSALSMLGGRRLVWLRLSSEKAGPDKACAAALKAHLDGQFNPEAFFLIEGAALGRDSALRKAAESGAASVSIPVYEDETGDVARMTREVLSRDDVGLSRDALDVFVSRLPRERALARAEIERLALYIGPGSGRTIDVAELEAHLGVEPEASLSDAAMAAFGARAGEAQKMLRLALGEGEAPPAAARATISHLTRLQRIHTLTRNGASAKEAGKAAGVFWKQEAEMLRQARVWGDALLAEMRERAIEVEVATKSTGQPGALMVERLLMEIAGRARRMGL